MDPRPAIIGKRLERIRRIIAVSAGKGGVGKSSVAAALAVVLRDLVGAAHPVAADVGCRNTVFNALAQSAAEYVPRMLALGVRHFRVEFLDEPPDLVKPTLGKYRQLLAGRVGGAEVWRDLKLLNQLGVTRGQIW